MRHSLRRNWVIAGLGPGLQTYPALGAEEQCSPDHLDRRLASRQPYSGDLAFPKVLWPPPSQAEEIQFRPEQLPIELLPDFAREGPALRLRAQEPVLPEL